jgi:hypothetical protein
VIESHGVCTVRKLVRLVIALEVHAGARAVDLVVLDRDVARVVCHDPGVISARHDRLAEIEDAIVDDARVAAEVDANPHVVVVAHAGQTLHHATRDRDVVRVLDDDRSRIAAAECVLFVHVEAVPYDVERDCGRRSGSRSRRRSRRCAAWIDSSRDVRPRIARRRRWAHRRCRIAWVERGRVTVTRRGAEIRAGAHLNRIARLHVRHRLMQRPRRPPIHHLHRRRRRSPSDWDRNREGVGRSIRGHRSRVGIARWGRVALATARVPPRIIAGVRDLVGGCAAREPHKRSGNQDRSALHPLERTSSERSHAPNSADVAQTTASQAGDRGGHGRFCQATAAIATRAMYRDECDGDAPSFGIERCRAVECATGKRTVRRGRDQAWGARRRARSRRD